MLCSVVSPLWHGRISLSASRITAAGRVHLQAQEDEGGVRPTSPQPKKPDAEKEMRSDFILDIIRFVINNQH